MSPTILVIIGEGNWTLRALHLACAMAREADAARRHSQDGLVHHLEYLGAGVRESLLSYDEYNALQAYSAMADAYGVPVSIEQFEFTDYVGGLLSAADQSSAIAVFAPQPGGFVASVARLRLWWLRRVMRRPLYTLGEGDGPLVWMGSSAEGLQQSARQTWG